MKKYIDLYMEEHCIDVFFSFVGFPIHILTSGNILPPSLNDLNSNRTLQETTEHVILQYAYTDWKSVYHSDFQNSVIINYDYCNQVQNQVGDVLRTYHSLNLSDNDLSHLIPSMDDFIEHFVLYALLGFHSYNCSEIHENGTATYRKVATPIKNKSNSYFGFVLPEYTIYGVSPNVKEMPDMFVM